DGQLDDLSGPPFVFPCDDSLLPLGASDQERMHGHCHAEIAHGDLHVTTNHFVIRHNAEPNRQTHTQLPEIASLSERFGKLQRELMLINGYQNPKYSSPGNTVLNPAQYAPALVVGVRPVAPVTRSHARSLTRAGHP